MSNLQVNSSVMKKLQSIGANQIKQMIFPYLKRRCSNLSERPEFIDIKQRVCSYTPEIFSKKITGITSDQVAYQLSEFVSRGVVFGVSTLSYAGWVKLSRDREDAFRKSKESYDATAKQHADGMHRTYRRIERKTDEKQGGDELEETIEESIRNDEEKEGQNVGSGENVNYPNSEQKAVNQDSGVKHENQESGGVHENQEDNFPLDLVILISLCDTKISNQNPSVDKHLLYVQRSYPKLEVSRDYIAERINFLEESFKNSTIKDGDDSLEKEFFYLSRIVWGSRDGK
ncbi:hypothetical protein KY290_032355 [Solanum tuberosum]|uniref:Uncharacterized protein n=2 Tax=Solanum tuberosum TaxID=4113 RepID=A0ABQ7UDL5_SOLTU|nr:hypothetical protein KY290_032355 [Solanum tuberosum]